MSDQTGGPARQPNPVVSVGWKMSAAFAAVLITFLTVGLLLPGTWSAEASAEIEASPASIHAMIASPARWDEWAGWPEMAFAYDGPESGLGATRSWDEREIGSGTFTVTEDRAPSHVQYRVEVDGGRLVTLGSFTLEGTGGGTRVTWRETGDFGWNPLLAWAALSMKRNHGAELERRLGDLRSVAESRSAPQP